MADLKRLSVVICGSEGGGEAFVAQAFINGLPEAAMKSVEVEALGKNHDLDWSVRLARAHVKATRGRDEEVAAIAQTRGKPDLNSSTINGLRCYRCGGSGHIALECATRMGCTRNLSDQVSREGWPR